MNKKELIEAVASKLDCTTSLANELVNTVIGTITESVLAWEAVNIKGFGKFFTRKRAAKKGFNMATNKAIEIPAYTAFAFKTWATVKRNIKNKFK